MAISTDVGIWIGALCTIGLFSYFYKENPLYNLVENLYVGAVAGHAITIGWTNIKNLGLKPVQQGDYSALVWVVMGLLLYTRYNKKLAYLSRISVSLLVGAGAGMSVRGTVVSSIVNQITATLLDITKVDNLLIVLGAITTLTYFFYSMEHKGALGYSAKIGRYFMMITFGAAFGNTIMGRMSLLIGRLQYLWGDWLGIIK